mgnify:CR=1 FL=1
MRWVTRYYIKRDCCIESVHCAFEENAIDLCKAFLKVGICSWVEDSAISEDFKVVFGRGMENPNGS